MNDPQQACVFELASRFYLIKEAFRHAIYY
jgi:hypothetical protein